MADSKSIELILQAKLESSQAVSQAEQMGRAIVTQIESAIDNSNIGEKLMNKVMQVFRSNFSQYMGQEQGGSYSGGGYTPQGSVSNNYTKTASGLYMPPSMTDQAQAGSAPPTSTAHASSAFTQSAQQAQQQAQMAGAARTAQSSSVGAAFGQTPFAGPFSAIASSLGGRYSNILDNHAMMDSVSTDTLISKVKTGQLMKKIDPNYNTDQLYSKDELRAKRDEMKGVAAAGASESGRLADVMERLIKSIDMNSERRKELENKQKNGGKLSGAEAEEYQSILSKEEQLGTVQGKKDMADANLRQASVNAAAADAALGPGKTGMLGSAKFWGGVGAAGTIAAGIGQLPGHVRQFGADYADITNMDSRAMRNGDLDKVLAMNALGGQGSMQKQGGFETGMGILGKTLSYGAIGAAGGSFIPGLGTVAGGLAGMGVGLYQGLTGASSAMKGSMEDQVQKHMAENAELYDLTKTGRGAAIGGYRSAQAMNAPGLSYYLSGGENLRDKVNAGQGARDNLEEIQSKYANINNLRPTARARAVKERDAALSSAHAAISGFDKNEDKAALMSTFDPITHNTENFRTYAVNRGLSNSQYDQTLGSLGAHMGGDFGDSNGIPEVMKAKGGLRNILDARGAGLSNAADIAGGLFQGGASRGDAMRMTKELFEDAVAGGFDKASAGKAMVTMSQQAANGMGGEMGARSSMTRAMAAAQDAFGAGGHVEGSQLDYVQRTQDYNERQSKSGGGLGMVSGFMAAQSASSAMRKMGVTGQMSVAEANTLRKLGDTGSDSDIRTTLEQFGHKGITDKNQAEVGKMVRNLKNVAADKRAQIGDEQNEIFDVENGRFRTLAERNAAKGVQAGLSKDGSIVDKNGFKAGKAAADNSDPGKNAASKSELADADKIIKGLSTLELTFGALDTALHGVITRAESVLKGSAKTFANQPGASNAPQPGGKTAGAKN